MAQAIVANKSGFLACLSTHAVSCFKSWNWVWLLKSHSSESAQTTSSLVQVHKACRGSSGAKEHRSHVGSLMMVRRTRFFFDGKVFLQALQTKFLGLFGVCKAQTPFHRSLSWSWLNSCLSNSDSSFKNLYPDLHVYFPSFDIAQTILSFDSIWLFDCRSLLWGWKCHQPCLCPSF